MYQSFAAPKRPTPVFFGPENAVKHALRFCPRKSKRKEIKTVMLTVMKFGGSSVADLAHIRNVAQRCIEKQQARKPGRCRSPAMGKTTDGLIATAKQITENRPAARWICFLPPVNRFPFP